MSEYRPVLVDAEADLFAKALYDRYHRLCRCKGGDVVPGCIWHWPTKERRSMSEMYERFTERRRGRMPWKSTKAS